MWGKPPFSIPESFAVDVGDLDAARTWYKEKLGLRDSRANIGDDSGRPHIVLQLEKDQYISLVQSETHASAEPTYGNVPPLLFAGNLTKAYEWLAKRGVAVEPITQDSGGNELFHFSDLDGNRLEVCKQG